jgi:hypothetical protein
MIVKIVKIEQFRVSLLVAFHAAAGRAGENRAKKDRVKADS